MQSFFFVGRWRVLSNRRWWHGRCCRLESGMNSYDIYLSNITLTYLFFVEITHCQPFQRRRYRKLIAAFINKLPTHNVYYTLQVNRKYSPQKIISHTNWHKIYLHTLSRLNEFVFTITIFIAHRIDYDCECMAHYKRHKLLIQSIYELILGVRRLLCQVD